MSGRVPALAGACVHGCAADTSRAARTHLKKASATWFAAATSVTTRRVVPNGLVARAADKNVERSSWPNPARRWSARTTQVSRTHSLRARAHTTARDYRETPAIAAASPAGQPVPLRVLLRCQRANNLSFRRAGNPTTDASLLLCRVVDKLADLPLESFAKDRLAVYLSHSGGAGCTS
jgi:hypothetical protein